MKNFFKKLSFVLAIAMVLTSLAPATASAAAKNYIKDSRTGKKVTSIYVYVGGAEATLTPYVNGKKASKVTIVNSNPERATVDDKGTITPVANGNTTLTFTKGKTTIGKVTVKVRTRAKALNIYDRAEYAAGKKEKLSEVTLKVGEKKDLQITMPISKAAKKVVKKSTYFTYAEYDSSVVKVNKLGNGQRHFEVEAVAAGTTKVTIVANQKTEKNVRADKYYKEASFDVTVKDEKLNAKQTGAAKITVTGTDLTDKVADYTVKRGTVTLSLKEVKLSEDKTEAVLTSSSSNMPKGDYTLKFGELEAQFTVEEAKTASIVIDPEKAIMTSTTTAVAYYKVFNQFDEDVTAGTLGANVDATGSDGALIDRAGKKVTFTNANGYTMNLSQVSLALVDKTNGVNVSKILTVSEGAKLNSVEFAGVYKLASGSYTKKDLAEGLTRGAQANAYYLLFAAKDQYGMAYSVIDNPFKLNVNVLSTTGLELATTGSPAAPVVGTTTLADGVTYYTFQLDVNASFAGLGSGEVTIMTVALTNGAQTKDTITVTPAKKIAKLTVSNADVYGNTDNELTYEALDADGNAVTDYATLKALNNSTNIQQFGSVAGKVEFVRKADGTAKLVYHAISNTATINTPVVLTFLSQTNVFATANLNVLPNPTAKAIIGFDDGVVLGAVSGSGVSIKRKDLKFQDQYGNVMADDDVDVTELVFTVNGGDALTGKLATAFANWAGLGVTTGASASTTEIVSTGAVAADATNGTQGLSIKVAIKDVAGSDYTFKVYAVDLADMTDFVVGDIYTQIPAGTSFGCPQVYGYYSNVKVALASSMYDVHDGNGGKDVTAPAITASVDGYVVKDGEFTVDIHNASATQIKKAYKYSNVGAKTELSIISPYVSGSYYFTRTVAATTASVTHLNALVDVNGGAVVSAKDQYGNDSSSTMYIKVSGFEAYVAAGTLTVSGNGTTDPTLAFTAAGEYTLTVTFSTVDGASLEETITFIV